MWMKSKSHGWWGLLWLVSLFSCQQPEMETPTSGRLKVLTSESHVFLVQKQADLFNSLYDKANIAVAGASTRECFVHLINDSVRLIVTDRQLNDEERRIIDQAEMKINEMIVAGDALALLVHKLNDCNRLSLETLKKIIQGTVRNWSEIPSAGLTGPLVLVTTGKNSGAYELVKYHFFNLQQDFTPAVVMETQKQVVQYVAKNPLALGVVSFACFLDSSLKAVTATEVRTLNIAGFDSSGAAKDYSLYQYYVYTKEYPLTYPIYVYFNNKSKLALGFSAFIASAPGQRIITKTGLAPATMPVRYVQQKREE